MLWGRGGHGLSLYVSVSRVSLYRDIDTKTSFVFWFVLCHGCICICVQTILTCCIEWNCVDAGDKLCIYISAVAKRTHLSYSSDSTFVFFAFLPLNTFLPKDKTLETDLNFSSWFHVSALAKCGLKSIVGQSGFRFGSMDGWKMSQKLFSQRSSKRVPKA